WRRARTRCSIICVAIWRRRSALPTPTSRRPIRGSSARISRPMAAMARARIGLSIVDLMTGLFAAFALVSGVLAARESGKGRDLDVSLFDTALQNLAY